MSRMTKLVLGRLMEESVILELPDGRQVKVTPTKFTGYQGSAPSIRLAFEAPADIRIMRAELMGGGK